MTKNDAVNSCHGQTLYHKTVRGSDKAPARCRVNGKCKTWKTRPEMFQLPVKHGLYTCFYITEDNMHEWGVSEEEAKGEK